MNGTEPTKVSNIMPKIHEIHAPEPNGPKRHNRLTLDQWRKWTEWPMTGAAVVFLVVYSYQVLARPSSTIVTETIMNIIWVMFATDYIVSLILSDNRQFWFFRHLFDLATVVLPMLRPLRLLRLFMVLKVLNRTSGMALRGRIAIYVVGAVTMMIYVGALAVYDVEQYAPTRQIDDFGDAVWWAFVTVTTVGYGDYAPTTWQGRLVAAALMLGGITLIGVVSAMVASWIMERVQVGDQKAFTKTLEAQMSRELDEDAQESATRDANLEAKIDALSAQLAQLIEERDGERARSREPLTKRSRRT